MSTGGESVLKPIFFLSYLPRQRVHPVGSVSDQRHPREAVAAGVAQAKGEGGHLGGPLHFRNGFAALAGEFAEGLPQLVHKVVRTQLHSPLSSLEKIALPK